MSLDIVAQLVKATPKKRLKMILEMQEKNIAFFRKYNEELANFIRDSGTGGYEIQVTPDFLEIIDKRTGQTCHPPGKFYEYLTQFGSPHHTGWIDKLEVLHSYMPGIEHGQRLIQFVERMHKELPFVIQRMATGEISLPRLKDGRRYSGVTVFLGIFTGLHIAHYLSHVEIRDIVMLEPDLDRFGLSCCFLDYAALEKRFGRLVLHIGPDMPENPPSLLIDKAQITATAWLRFLPAYPSEEFSAIIDKFNIRWRALIEIFVPFDREVRNLTYGMSNLLAQRPINDTPRNLSQNSRIAIVASGPSLDKELTWLKVNQDKLIIFAAHSAVRTLKKAGIRPDFQFSLDTELEDSLLEKLDLYYDVPFVSYYKARPESLAKFQHVLLVNEFYKANPVKFDHPITYTHPTTGNLMAAVATFAKPKQLYIVGLDLGFRDVAKDHAVDYWAYQDNKASTTLAENAVMVASNFMESQGQIYTNAYLNTARNNVEAALGTLIETSTYNLSDGAKIDGSEAKHSHELELTDYPEKQADIVQFTISFSGEKQGVWSFYKTPGNELLDILRTQLEQSLRLKKFDWTNFAIHLDNAWSSTLHACLAQEVGDLRAEAYMKFVQDLLTEWYRVIIFTKSPQETQKAYDIGLKVLLETLEEVKWPTELVAMEEESVIEVDSTSPC
ncbi:MAG: DUF115 domain-containing protein [Thiotrichaceae bacterium]|nr:DUF115 domain-containing protein [Thiotrichaceae bacterium]